MLKPTLFITLLFTTISLISYGQTPMKFGKIEMSDLSMTTYEKDTSASAVVLTDYGATYFEYNQIQGDFKIVFDHHVRIKVLNKKGYDWADGAIPFYETNGAKESVSGLKGFTHNLEGGKWVKHKLEKSATFEEKINDNWHQQKFTMPNVQEGSIIEYSYKIISDFKFQLREWNFQKTIPVMWSEYKVAIPEYYDYKQLYQGYVPFTINESSKKNDNIVFNTKSRRDGRQTSFSQDKVDFISNSYRWVCQDVPAFKKEKHMTTMDNYITKIELELSSFKLPYSVREPVMDTWETLNKKLSESESFGVQLKRRSFLKDQVENITSGLVSPEEKAAAIFWFVQNRMDWNGAARLYTDGGIKKAYDAKKGSSAEINLLMTTMLQIAGIEANPVILSTRKNGLVNTIYPILSKFNYVICLAEIGDKSYILDATEKFISINNLPLRCMNGQGRVVGDNPRWINLQGVGSLSQSTSAKVKLTNDGRISGKIIVADKGYSAASNRSTISANGEEKFIKDLQANKSNWSIESYSFENLKDSGKTLKGAYEVSIDDMAQVAGNLIYLNPLLTEGEQESPFKLENRQYPVDLGCSIKDLFMMELVLPEGYQVEEVPANKVLALPNNDASFRYSITQRGEIIQVVSSITFKKPFYGPQEYAILKEFYAQIVAKHAEQIVLKKI